MVLYTLSIIWKNGGVFNVMKNGEIELDLSKAKKIPEVVLKTAESIYDGIKSFLISVEGMNNTDKTIWMMHCVFCGWQENEKIKSFLNEDEAALNFFYEYQAKLNANGYNDIYSDYREFEDSETSKIKEMIFRHAVRFSKKR